MVGLMKVLIPTVAPVNVDKELGVDVIIFDPTLPIPDEHTDAEIMVVWGNTRKQLADSAARLTNIKWLCSLAAGTEIIENAGFAPSVIVTSGSGLQDAPVAEHTLMLILAAVRRFDLLHTAQLEGRWARELAGAQPGGVQRGTDTFPGLGMLLGARVTIWGFGSIAQRLAPLLAALGAHVTGVANTAGERAGFPVIATSDVATLLPNTDLLVNILPSTPLTAQIVSASVFEQLPNHAWFVNVGRGATVDEEALIAALSNGTIGGAALDVFAWEPLPADSPLWATPNTILSPHNAGGRPIGATEFFNKNLAAFLAGTVLDNVVAR